MRMRWPGGNVRGRTLACGIALGGVLMIVMALVGGSTDAPSGTSQPATEDLGPLTAVQPQLQQALLSDEDLPPAEPLAAPPPNGPATVRPAPPPPPLTGESWLGTELGELCRVLLADPAGIAGLPGLWQATPPRQATAQHTGYPGGGGLRQMLGVFEPDTAGEAYQRLRESASGCDRFPATLEDGTAVTMMLRDLTGGRTESTRAGGKDGLAVGFLRKDGTSAGWLVLDRVGPVISVLHHLGPAGESVGDPAVIRGAALAKVLPLLPRLRG